MLGVVSSTLVLAWLLTRFWGNVSSIGSCGYLAVFLGETANSAALLIPTPASLYTGAMAVVMNPFLLGAVGGLSAALGEMVGYAIGSTGRGVLEGGPLYSRFQALAGRRSGVAVFVLATLPLFPDVAGLWAGADRYPLWQFLVFTTAGKVLKVTLFALVVFSASSR